MEKFIDDSLEIIEKLKKEKEEKREAIFNSLIINDIASVFSNELEDCGFESEEVKEFQVEISHLKEEEIKGVLSMPKELRIKNFPKYLLEIRNGTKTIPEIIKGILETAKKHGYTLGFHVTNNKIIQNGNEWIINGKELDDRDDMAMAYYSLDYKNIFRSDRRKFLYVIRANIGKETEHKRDTSNNWGRASTLSIVHEIDLNEIDNNVDIKIEEIRNQKGGAE